METKLKPSRARASQLKFMTASKTQSTGPREATPPPRRPPRREGAGRRPHVPVPERGSQLRDRWGGGRRPHRVGSRRASLPSRNTRGLCLTRCRRLTAPLRHERRGLCAPVDGAVPTAPPRFTGGNPQAQDLTWGRTGTRGHCRQDRSTVRPGARWAPIPQDWVLYKETG